MLGEQLHNKDVENFFSAKSQIILATSMSKKGWLVENVITQRRTSTRLTQPATNPDAPKTGGGFLGFGNKNNNSGEQQ